MKEEEERGRGEVGEGMCYTKDYAMYNLCLQEQGQTVTDTPYMATE